jgi:DNA-directed RNA polymerase specialized sigma24 family protein
MLMCGQREDAEEVAQEALLKVFENFSQLREPERVRPWVFSDREERLPHEAAKTYF